jgi:hypothetical protein
MRTDELERRRIVEAGGTVLANKHKGTDDELIAWAKENGHYVYIGDRVRFHPEYERSIWYDPPEYRRQGAAKAIKLTTPIFSSGPICWRACRFSAPRCWFAGAIQNCATASS